MNLQPNIIFANRYCLLSQLGIGGFSEVWLASDQMAGDMHVALKIYAPGQGLDEKAIQIFRDEYKVVFYIEHPNLLKPLHFDIFNGKPYLVLPYCKGGSIINFVGKVNETTIAQLLSQIGSALNHLHTQEVPLIHRDIKPENILTDGNGRFYISDFGVSSKLRRTLTKSIGKSSESKGTTAFMAPELFLAKRTALPASDVFSVGVMLFELLSDDLPFGQLGGMILNTGAEIPELDEKYPTGLSNLIKSCLHEQPEKRPTAKELEQAGASFLTTGNWDSQQEGRKTKKITEAPPNTNPKKTFSFEEKPKIEDQNNTELTKNPRKKLILFAVIFLAFILLSTFVFVFKLNKHNEYEQKANRFYALAQYDSTIHYLNEAVSWYGKDSTKFKLETLKTFNEGYKSFLNAEYSRAFEILNFSAQRGLPDAHYFIAELYFNGIGTAKDSKKGKEHIEYAVKGGFKMALWRFGYFYTKGIDVEVDKVKAEKYYFDAISAIKPIAEAGEPEAMANLGSFYSLGLGVATNEKLAFEWYLKASEKGYAFAMQNLANKYRYGNGVDRNVDEALKWYRRSAEMGNPASQYTLADILFDGYITTQNETEGLDWLRKAADQNYAEALNRLGVFHYRGKYVQQDYAKAFEYQRKAVDFDNDNITAINNIAYLYRYGEGVSKNYVEAIRYYQLAADKDEDVRASNLCKIGMMYYEGGYGISKDTEKAKEFFTKSAELGDSDAQFNIGFMLFNENKRQEAKPWLEKALQNGEDGAKKYLDAIKYDALARSKPFEVVKAEHTNVINGNTNYGYSLYKSSLKHMQFRFTFNSYLSEGKNVEIYIKIFSPSGDMFEYSKSPSGFSDSKTIYIPGSYQKGTTFTIGNYGFGTWQSGYYKYELYYNSSRIYNGSVYVYN